MISTMKATMMLKKGCMGFLASWVMPQRNELKLQDIALVKEFPDVFSDDLPS